jgi:hypothetical protein
MSSFMFFLIFSFELIQYFSYFAESVLSMEIASTGPQSLRSDYNTDTEYTMQSEVTEYSTPPANTQLEEDRSDDEAARRLWQTADEESVSNNNNNNNNEAESWGEGGGGQGTEANGGCSKTLEDGLHLPQLVM